MNFFRLRRTKMLDDAVLDHKPQNLLIVFLVFYLVYFIGNLLSAAITSIPTIVWVLNYEGLFDAIKQYTDATIAGDAEAIVSLESFVYDMLLNMPSWLIAVSLFASLSFIVASIFYCKKFEKRPLSSLGIRKKDVLKEYGIGSLIGAVMLGLSFLIAFLFGGVSISLNPDGVSPMITLFFIAFVIQGAGEEILFRGYFMMSIARDYKTGIAIATSSVMFSLIHSGNSGYGILPFINILLFGIFIGVYVFKRGDIWGACAIHTLWNFAQGCIIGSSVSGINQIPSVFIMKAKENMDLANGGQFGLEASVATTIVLLTAVSLVFLLKTKKGEESLSDAVFFE